MTSSLPTKALQAVAQYWQDTARRNTRDWFIIIDMYGGKNSAITKVSGDAMSYPHRNHTYLYEFYDRVRSGSYPSNGFSFLDGWVKTFTDNLSRDQWGMYINYADPTLNRADAERLYYGQNLAKLQQLKAQLDPTELFYYPQAISPAK